MSTGHEPYCGSAVRKLFRRLRRACRLSRRHFVPGAATCPAPSFSSSRKQVWLLNAIRVVQASVSNITFELLYAHLVKTSSVSTADRWLLPHGVAQGATSPSASIDRFTVRVPVLTRVGTRTVWIPHAAGHVAGKLKLWEHLVAVRTGRLDLHLLTTALLHVEREATDKHHLPARWARSRARHPRPRPAHLIAHLQALTACRAPGQPSLTAARTTGSATGQRSGTAPIHHRDCRTAPTIPPSAAGTWASQRLPCALATATVGRGCRAEASASAFGASVSISCCQEKP